MANATHKTRTAAVICSLCALWIYACDEVTDRFSSISFVEVAAERTKLINGIESYQSIEEAKGKLAPWELIEQSGLNPQDKRPPFNIYKVAVEHYLHLGVSGKLHLVFFNNRLLSTWFYPDTFEKYLKLLNEKETVKLQDTRSGVKEAMIRPHTHVWLAEDYKGQAYVGWEDARLQKEMSIWIKRYS